jgi:hypothetical protein
MYIHIYSAAVEVAELKNDNGSRVKKRVRFTKDCKSDPMPRINTKRKPYSTPATGVAIKRPRAGSEENGLSVRLTEYKEDSRMDDDTDDSDATDSVDSRSFIYYYY